MKVFGNFLLACVAVVGMSGCGNDEELQVNSDVDELKQWVDDNPAPDEIPLSDSVDDE